MSRSGRVLAVFGVPVVVLLAACGGAAPPSGLPTIGATSTGGTTAPTPTVTSSSPWTAEQQEVLDGLRRYDGVVLSISGGEPLDMARLRGVATGKWAQEVGQNLQVTKAEGFVMEAPASGVRREFSDVTVAGSKATITACEDPSGIRVIKNGTPQPRSSEVYKPRLLSIFLVFESNAWKVAGTKNGDVSC